MNGKESKLSINDSEYMKIMYVKCIMRNEYESYLRRNDFQYFTNLKAGLFSLLLQ